MDRVSLKFSKKHRSTLLRLSSGSDVSPVTHTRKGRDAISLHRTSSSERLTDSGHIDVDVIQTMDEFALAFDVKIQQVSCICYMFSQAN